MLRTSLCLIVGEVQIAFLWNFTPIEFNNNNDPHYCENLCNFHPFHPSRSPRAIDWFCLIVSKTLETDNVLQESQSFNPCAKAEIDVVEIKCPVSNAILKFVSEWVKYWVETQQHHLSWISLHFICNPMSHFSVWT